LYTQDIDETSEEIHGMTTKEEIQEYKDYIEN
jgi:hypothetical protein